MKKVLIIAYYWPPAGGPGVQRWLKFVKYLPEFDIEPVVFVPENPHYPLQDPSLVKEVPAELRLLKAPIFEPYGLAGIFSGRNTRKISSGLIPSEEKQTWMQRFLLFIRGNFFVPDARKFWVRPSVQFLEKTISEDGIDTVITTGPPHSVHLIGLNLKNNLNIKWIADFRDPWTEIAYHKQLKLLPWTRKKHLKLEQQVLDSSDLLLVTSFTTREEFRSKTRTPVELITNGFEKTEREKEDLDQNFSLAHIGSFLSGRNPKVLWQALAELAEAHPEFSQKLELRLVGAVSEAVMESLEDFGLRPYLKLEGYVPHERAMEFQAKSQILLLIEIDRPETRGIIPGKLFEYMASRRPVLAIGPAGADIESILSSTAAGSFFTYNQKEGIKQFLIQSFEAYQRGELNSEAKDIEKYSRRNLTSELAAQIFKLWE